MQNIQTKLLARILLIEYFIEYFDALRNLVRAITIQPDSADVATNIYQCVLLFIKVSYFLEFNTFHEFNFL